jgi:hypothetical protein
MDRFLLNSNWHCDSENKEGTLSTVKIENVNDSYLDFGFTSTEVDGKERPQKSYWLFKVYVFGFHTGRLGKIWIQQGC